MSGFSVLPLIGQRQSMVYVDVGSAMTKVIRQGQVIFHEPSLVVIDTAHQDLIALGAAAANLSGKLTPDFKLAPVITSGQISDSVLFTLYMRGLQQKLSSSRLDRILGLPVTYSQNSASSEFSQKITRQAWSQAGWRIGQVMNKHQALHAALPRPFLCVVDHGGAVTEVVVYSQSKVLLAQTLPLGGERYTRAIMDIIRSQNGVVMSWAGAEQVKQKIGRVSVQDETTDTSTKISVRASQAGSRTHQTLVLHSDQFLAGLNQQVDGLCQQLEQCFSQLSSQAMTELSHHGIIMSGGSSQLKGLAARISATLNLPISLAPNPELCLVKGMAAEGGE